MKDADLPENAPNEAQEKPTLLLDLMGTLIPDPFYEAAKKVAGSLEEFGRFRNPEAYIHYENGKWNQEEYLRGLLLPEKREHAPFTPENFAKELLNTPPPYDYVSEALPQLADRFRLVLASNYGPWVHEHLSNAGLDRWLDAVYASYMLGVRKPSPLFFQRLLEALDISPDQAYFVDDVPENVAAARDAGIESFLAEPNWPSRVLAQF